MYLNSPLTFDGLLRERKTPRMSEVVILGTVSGAVGQVNANMTKTIDAETNLLVLMLQTQMYCGFPHLLH